MNPIRNSIESIRALSRRVFIPAALLFIALFSATAAPFASAQAVAVQSTAQQTQHVFPGERWERVESPEAAGYSTEKLAEARAHLESIGTTGAMVVVGGRALFEHGNIEELSYIASVRKSVLAMLFGNYVASGKIDMTKTLAELNITDIGGLSDREREATIADLISARSGVYHPASNSGDNLAQAPPRGSVGRGEYFLYSNWDFNTLGTIFEQESGVNIYDALEADLAKPIGMQDFDRARHRKSGNLRVSMHPAYHMHFSTRDMARLGYLMLRGGKWGDKQIVPADWAKKISSVVTPLEEMNPAGNRRGQLGYGYLWWIFDGPRVPERLEGAYTGIGAGGQYITVIPKLDMVVAHKTNRDRGGPAVARGRYIEFLDKIAAARNN
jgi:CubicO group peptidase (beta-lactamase class C family)